MSSTVCLDSSLSRGHTPVMSYDWVDDENLSREETLARFKALNPEPARGLGFSKDQPSFALVPSYTTLHVGSPMGVYSDV